MPYWRLAIVEDELGAYDAYGTDAEDEVELDGADAELEDDADGETELEEEA